MHHRSAIAEAKHIAHQPRRGLIGAIIIGSRTAKPVRGHDNVTNLKHCAVARADDVGHFHPALSRSGKRGSAAIHVTGRNYRKEHAVNRGGINRLAVAHPAGSNLRKRQFNLRIIGRARAIGPGAHIPGPRCATRVLALNRQRRAVDRIERDHPARTPAKGKRRAGVIAVSLIGEQRMVEPVMAFPDQPGKIALGHKHRIDAQRIGRSGDQRGHHRAREIDRPEARIEPLNPVGFLPLAGRGEPEGHVCES